MAERTDSGCIAGSSSSAVDMTVSRVGLVRVKLIGSGFTRFVKGETGRHDLVSFSTNIGITDEPGIRAERCGVYVSALPILTVNGRGHKHKFQFECCHTDRRKLTKVLLRGNLRLHNPSKLLRYSKTTRWALPGSETRRCLQMSPSF